MSIRTVYLDKGDSEWEDVRGWRGESVNPTGKIKWWVWVACATLFASVFAFHLWWEWTEPNPPPFPHNDRRAYQKLYTWTPSPIDGEAIFSINLTNANHTGAATETAIYVSDGWDCIFAWKDRLDFEHCIDESGDHTMTYKSMDGSDTIRGIHIDSLR